jgi:hypothetical protein
MRKLTLPNRYGDQLWFELVEPNLYKLCGDLEYCRFGGKPDQNPVDYNDLAFFDPSGGPFISEGYPIEGKVVKQITVINGEVYFRVE